jgi:hypothetical protein
MRKRRIRIQLKNLGVSGSLTLKWIFKERNGTERKSLHSIALTQDKENSQYVVNRVSCVTIKWGESLIAEEILAS